MSPPAPKAPRSPASPVSRAAQPSVSLLLDWYHPEIHAGVVRAARDFGWNLDDDRCRGHHGRFLPQDWMPDGVIATTATDPVLEWVRQVPVPVVRVMDDCAPGSEGGATDGIPTVVPCLREAGQMAAQHLLSLGIPNIAFYRYYRPRNDNAVFPAFMECCRKAGIDSIILDFPKAYAGIPHSQWPGRPARLDWLKEQLAHLPLPCAIMADDDRFAIDVVTEAIELGLRVPEDVAVLGVMDMKLVHQRLPTGLSSVNVNLEQVGYEAGRKLDQLMRGERVETLTRVPARGLIERKSTSTYQCDDPRISRTVVRIRRDHAEPLSVPGLAREAGMSVRALQRAYSIHCGESIRDALMECRLNAAAALLRDTDLKLESVACESGLGNATNLCRMFKKRFGRTPGAWRQKL
jgi:LacI family transcriptional regulator